MEVDFPIIPLKDLGGKYIKLLFIQVCSQDHFFWGGGEGRGTVPPKSGPLWASTTINPLTKTPFLAHFVAESGPFGRFEGVSHHPHSLAIIGLFSLFIDLTVEVQGEFKKV